MQIFEQTVDEVANSLSSLPVDWMDDTAEKAIAKLATLPRKAAYARDDVATLLHDDFDIGILCCRLFLARSQDAMEDALRKHLPGGGIGVKRFKAEPQLFLEALETLGLLDAMAEAVNRQSVWSDVLVERLRSGRGSAIQGQRRGRGLEDFVEVLVRETFDLYEPRCTFTGVGGRFAKCDVAVPDRHRPRIIIEVKGYGATGSKMTDIIGDLDAIIEAKRHDATLLFVTDGSTWRSRMADLSKIVKRQNEGKIARIYTMQMRDALAEDLRTLKAELRL